MPDSASTSPSPPADGPLGATTSAAAAAAVAAARSRRRVSNLSPSQIEKKRAIDRTNQQHWRQKKRLYIAELEAEVARLQASLDESAAKLRVYEAGDGNEQIEEEAGAELGQSDRLQLPSPARSAAGLDANSIISAVSALSAGYVLDGGSASLPSSADLGWPLVLTEPVSVSRDDLLAQQTTHTQAAISSELGLFDAGQSFQFFSSGLDDGLFPAPSQYADTSVSAALDRQYYRPPQYDQQAYYSHIESSDDHSIAHDTQRYSAVFGAGGAPSPLMTGLPYVPYYLAGRSTAPGPSVPDWMALPLNLPVSTEIDKLVLITAQTLVERYSAHELDLNHPDFPSVEGHIPHLRSLNLQKTTAASTSAAAAAAAPLAPDGFRRKPVHDVGGGLAEFIGAPGEDADGNIETEIEAAAAAQSRPMIGAVASHVVWISPLKNLAGRLAFLYRIAVFLRWCLNPTKATYAALPDFMRPTPLQRRIPHPVWVDLIVWPDARDSMIRSGDYSAFELFRFVVGNSITMGWPYPDDASACIVPCGSSDRGSSSSGRSADGLPPRLRFHPRFEAHIRNVDNYSVTQHAATVFPMLSKYVRVTT